MGAVLSPCASAQEAPDEEEPSPESIVTGEGTVDVDSTPADDRIAERIREILEATQRFTDLDVEVIDGVVFLAGVADEEATRTLAADLATRTEGVAAVVNNLRVAEPPVWSLAPATSELRTLFRDVVQAAPLILIGIVILVIAWFAAKWIARLTLKLMTGRTHSELLQGVIQKAVFLVVLIIGIYLALRISGLTRIAITVVSGTGLIGLILGFAFRDIAENFLASLLLSIQRPFRLGDVVEVEGHLGIVRKVTARGTLLIDFDGNHIQIANATVYKNTIKNYSANPLMRIDFTVGIGYDDAIPHAQQVVRDVLESHPSVLDDPEPLVLVDQLGSSTVNLKVYFWINGAEHSTLKMKSSVMRLVVNKLLDAGVSMPDESREVIFPQGVPVRMEPEGDSAAPPPDVPTPREAAPVDEAVSVEAEGDLTSETADLNRQADRARDPEEGPSVLSADE